VAAVTAATTGGRASEAQGSDLARLHSFYVEPEEEAEPQEWPALHFADVFKIFRSGEPGSGPAAGVETVALRGLELEVAQGELLAVVGPSGCGKSTFLSLAAGLDQPSAGDVSAFGASLTRLGETELAAYRGRRTAVIFQSENLWPGLTAQENVETMLRLAGTAHPAAAATAALEAFGLGERRHHRVTALSGGEQQRVAVAGAAARRADLVLADEPTGELDAANESIVLDALRELRSDYGATVVVVSHSTRIADAADRVIELRDGRVVA
jgi:ABC-type lipoprotein export system ATPase subunit